MEWVREFYSTTGVWWGKADARVGERDLRRVRLLREQGVAAGRVLELGSGYGTTAVAAARAGYAVTAVEISDRADFTEELARDLDSGALTVHKGDFYDIEFDRRFDAVCYWNGFGIGSDADQRRLLERIAAWLEPGAVALVDVFNPFVWAGWDGDEEHLLPDPAAGYDRELRQRISFDPIACTATDTWWEPAAPERVFRQTLRCYTPADLTLLLDGTGLSLTGIVVGEAASDVAAAALLRREFEYLAILHRTP
ncbi:class I SAM-dependent methyltransferase [Nocardia sp. CDC159]|uniref:Class I SAM-dependent methyltransferase n=1 Tax=Nocardia pulmonis TaxID=2951408 RepID=A0A9X2E9Y6_9NOCA|nr:MULTISPECIES: class I SAM-dependent methyltransferase [Nocardia]MCM6774253.1 class I SAM-dependent methyltransferase [Nocardia pulmonis]MCM6787140.1 class I SAM-dependent methyltransferase [Nocardia sp. CDC159]